MDNLMLLSMSTMPKELKVNRFYEDRSNWVNEDCIGTMEPVVKRMLDLYPRDRLRIVMLCTKATFSPDNQQRVAVNYFINRICEHIGLPDENITTSTDGEEVTKYQSSDHRLEFVMIPLHEDELTTGIHHAVREIREWSDVLGEDKEKAHFWIDIHGGFRDAAQAINTIVSLLKVDEIEPERIMGTRIKQGETTGLILEQRESYDLIEFVSGMNDFINNGNSKTLIAFFKDHPKYLGGQTEKILEALNKTAEGMQLCHMITYTSGLDTLRYALDVIPDGDYTILEIFRDYFYRDFGTLLRQGNRELPVVERCVEKGMFQQALTFAESALPGYAMKCKFLKYSDRDVGNLIDSAKENWQTRKHYIFDLVSKRMPIFDQEAKREIQNTYRRSNRRNPNRGEIENGAYNAIYKAAVEEIARNAEAFRNELKEDGNPGLIQTSINCISNPESQFPFTVSIRSRRGDDQGEIELRSDIPERCHGHLRLLLCMHNLLRQCRNVFNHAMPDRPEMDKLEIVIRLYIDYFKYLVKTVNAE